MASSSSSHTICNLVFTGLSSLSDRELCQDSDGSAVLTTGSPGDRSGLLL